MIKSLTFSEYISQKVLKISTPMQKSLYIVLISLLGSILLAIASKINFNLPFTPIPFTMQTFAVLFLSMLLGKKVLYVLGLYIFEGILGLPVFSKGAGILYLLGPTGGYIFGFLVAGYICGTLAQQGFDKNFIKAFFAMILGNIIVYFCGALWLLRFMNFDIYKTISLGILPFIIGDIIKIVFASFALSFSWKKIKI
ncbi:MAG: biotin transporter BioY [Elusimicrobiota bacterium]|nr:biotin transporter BioY [Endomicrobiia bacterium]MCX7910616.1 biotin transporter BioY [Endomicrobiia bacterium]MDW8166356.1 biotin transporter BioY [Elusimicrobiota bacterium]